MQEILDNILEPQEKKTYVAATTSQRLVNHIIDIIGYTVFSTIFYFGIGFFNPDNALLYEESTSAADTILEYLFSILIILVYYTLSEYCFTGKTLGKLITKTRAVTFNDERLDFDDAIKRSACRLIPFEALSFLGDGASGWHDTIPNTKVIKDEGWVDSEEEYL